jgi:hypothetical protein
MLELEPRVKVHNHPRCHSLVAQENLLLKHSCINSNELQVAKGGLEKRKPSRLSTYFCPPLSAMICGASRPSGALADCCPVATVVGGVLVVTILAPIRGGNSYSLEEGKEKEAVEKT